MNPSEKHFQANRVLNSKCHYEVLGISRGANKKEIRKAFREMALQYHPDKNELPRFQYLMKRLKMSFIKL
jgi:DnaJ-class molecular chaperone